MKKLLALLILLFSISSFSEEAKDFCKDTLNVIEIFAGQAGYAEGMLKLDKSLASSKLGQDGRKAREELLDSALEKLEENLQLLNEKCIK